MCIIFILYAAPKSVIFRTEKRATIIPHELWFELLYIYSCIVMIAPNSVLVAPNSVILGLKKEQMI